MPIQLVEKLARRRVHLRESEDFQIQQGQAAEITADVQPDQEDDSKLPAQSRLK